jgi:opacity protein-like surface antigen
MQARYFAAAIGLAAASAASAQGPANWSGFYVGADGGGANARLKVSSTDFIFQLSNEFPAPPGGPRGPLIVIPGTTRDLAGSDNQISLLYGGFAGGQFQLGTIVLGVEGDIHGGRNAGRFSAQQSMPPTLLAPTSTLTQTRDLRIRYDWSARARFGIVAGQSLLYATGGIAQTRIRLTGEDTYLTPAGPASASSSPGQATFQSPTIGPVVTSFTRNARLTGWTGGIGGEHRIASHLSLGLDARYVDYGSKTIAFNCSFQSARTGTCGSYSTPPIVIYGRTHDATDTTPGAEPGPTRVSLSEWRLAARLVFRF